MTIGERMKEFSIPEPNSGCLLWIGPVGHKGYGTISYRGRRWIASRLSFHLEFGGIPAGLCVCHKCDTPACINPSHLFAGTHQDNTDDQIKKGRLPMGEKSTSHRLKDTQVAAIKADPRVMAIIAAEYKCSKALVESIKAGRRRKYLPGKAVKVDRRRTSRNLGRDHPLTKFTDSDILAIRADGRVNEIIAIERGVGRRCIDRIKTGQRWGHIK